MPAEIKIQEKLQSQIKVRPLHSESRLWIETIVYSIILFIVISAYYFITGKSFSGGIFNRIFADLAFILIGISLMLSSICYFWDFADKFIIYRKHLGLVGFAYLVIHILLSIFLPNYTPFAEYYLADIRIKAFIAAVIATIIFVGMTVISNRLAIHEIGPKRWRHLMRFGFIAYVLALYHFGAKGIQYWLPWLTGKSESLFPSFGMMSFAFGLTVIILRIALWIATSGKKISPTPQITTTPQSHEENNLPQIS